MPKVPRDPLLLTSEFVFLNEHFGAGMQKEKSGVKLIINYPSKSYKIMPAHQQGESFQSNLMYRNKNITGMREPSGEIDPPEYFEFIEERVPTHITSRHKAIAISLLEAIEFAEKELK